MSLIKDLVENYNVVARTEYNRAFSDQEPEIKAMCFEYKSGLVASKKFVFTDFLGEIEEFTGVRTHETFPDGYEFTVVNKEWDKAIDVLRKDLERASRLMNVGDSIQELNLYTFRISELGRMAKNQPYELAFNMLEAGDANTYGTCFDGQNLFDTTHSYSLSSGSQDNIVAGTCTTITTASLHTDILSVKTRFASFYIQEGGSSNARKRKLNKSGARMTIVAPVEYEGALYDLQQKDRLSSGESNTLKGAFDYITRNFTDTGDLYVLLNDEPVFKPFLYQVEVPYELDMPQLTDESAKERKLFTYGVYGRHNVAYGAWWKAIQVTN